MCRSPSVAPAILTSSRYLSFILLLVPLALSKHMLLYPRDTHAFSQSYYYAIISASVYCIISNLLLANLLGALVFRAYPPSFGSLTVPQRTLMLQTTAYVFYLALGAGVFSTIEGWSFVDGLYWADYTLLTCGLGTDFPLYRTLSRALLIPYAVIGITMIGLVIGSVRALVLERGATAMVRRRLEKERKKWVEGLDSSADVRAWEKREFEEMRRIQQRADWMKRYMALATSAFAFAVLWLIGALVFWYSEVRVVPASMCTSVMKLTSYRIAPPTMDIFQRALLRLHHTHHRRLRRLLPAVQLREALLRLLDDPRRAHHGRPHLEHGRHDPSDVGQGGRPLARGEDAHAGKWERQR